MIVADQNVELPLSWDGVWIAIPAYNEAGTIREVAQYSLMQCPRVIVIDDGSTDGTAARLQGLQIILLSHKRNSGKAACLRTAFTYALEKEACCVISIDGDGQHDPVDAPKLLTAWLRYPDHIVIGVRLHDSKQFPRARYYANRVACFWISWASGYSIPDTQSGFRVYPNAVMHMALGKEVASGGFVFESEILIEAARQGWQAVGVSIPGRYPVNARASHFRPVADITKIVLMVARRLLRQRMAPMGLLRSLKDHCSRL